MATYKPVVVQAFPKLGERITQDTVYWRGYKVCGSPLRRGERGAAAGPPDPGAGAGSALPSVLFSTASRGFRLEAVL